MYRRHLIRDFKRAQRAHRDWPVVLSEGDSWFSFADVIGRLDNPNDRDGEQRAWALLRREKNGDEIVSMLSGGQRSLLRQDLERWPLDAVLFSGGGNDIIGPDLLSLLRPFEPGMSARDLIAFSRFGRRLRQIQDCYRELLDLVSDAGIEAKVFVNSYDYVVPSDRPVRLLGAGVAGPWMLPFFERRRIPEQLYRPIARLLIDSFAAAVDAVASESRGFERLVRVETRGLLTADDWSDEIHPNRAGAFKVAEAFEKSLRENGVL
ncbi:MAG: hypothetical protein AAF725_21305 [Acidobacteriota bacterium]